MINYSYTEEDSTWKVCEKATGYVVYLTTTKKAAILMTNWLNAGGGFNGWTPGFFVDKKIQKDLK